MSHQEIRIANADGRGFNGYLAIADAGTGPGILLLHEKREDAGAHQLAELYAAEGYVVLCAEALAGADDIVHAIAALRARRECTGKVAVVASGSAGVPALRVAADKRVEAAICYSLTGIDAAIELAPRLACPVVLHFGDSDPAVPPTALERLQRAFADRPESAVYVYPGMRAGFERRAGANYDRAAAGLAHSRSIALLRRVTGPHYDLEALWEAHTRYEFGTRDVDATMATMVDDPYVNHVPVMTGGVGQRDLARFYANHFIPKLPKDTRLVPISRTVGADCVVDEMLFCFTHDTEIDFMLPGVPPTGRYVEVPTIAVVKFRGGKLCHEHIYWDQASVLVQIGLLDPTGLPVAGVETAKKLLDETRPSNTLMKRWAESAPQDG